MDRDNKDQPSVPAQKGLIITGTPTHDDMPPGIMGDMATGVPSQTVGTQGSLGSSAICVQPIAALQGDEPAGKVVPSPVAPQRAPDRRRVRWQHLGQTGSGQVNTPTATVVGSDVATEQSVATSTPLSVIPGTSAEAGAEKETKSAVSSEQEATPLNYPSGMCVESDEESLFSASEVTTLWQPSPKRK